MSDDFDPYYRWLGIPRSQQPPSHYRLLGLETFEDDADVIRSAAERYMMDVRTNQSGKYAAEAERLLNEIAAAKVCLLDRRKKAAYDGQLRSAKKSATEVPLVSPNAPQPELLADAVAAHAPQQEAAPPGGEWELNGRSLAIAALLGAGAALVVLMLCGGVALLLLAL